VAKVLNIDSIVKPVSRALNLGGVEYVVKDMTVENFMETTKAAEELKARAAGAVDQVTATIDMILRFIPDLPREKLRPLTFEQLGTIVAFVQGDFDPDAPAKEDPATAAGK
jgi:hypothetical protein